MTGTVQTEKGKTMSEYIVRETGYPGAVKQEVVGELVRCKDCRHFKYLSVAGFYICSHKNGMNGMSEEDFCSHGRKRDSVW